MPRLRIVSVNDVYSLENLPRLKSLVDHHAASGDHDAMIVVLAGDFLAPSLLSSIDAGRGMVDCLDAVGVTHVVLGNHEDDIPPEELRRRLDELDAVCIGTNVRAGLDLPRHAHVDVGELVIGLVGVVMSDLSVYRGKPFGGVELLPANEAALAEAELLLRAGVDAVVPITHQSVGDDRELATSAVARPFPVIVGGHDHMPMLVRLGSTWIVKAGAEAVQAVITVIDWKGRGDVAPTVTTRLEAVAGYPEDRELRARVERHMVAVHELSSATLLWIPPGMHLSSVGTRAAETSIGTLVCTRLRDCLGAEAAVFNGGGIRASRDYAVRLTYGDIEAEVPFDNEVVVVPIPGRVLQAAIAASRSRAPLESGAFLQVDDRTIVTGPASSIVSIAGAPFDPERRYLVALVRELLLGLDGIEPLVRWAAEEPSHVPPPDTGREPKFVLVQSFALGIWHELGGFDAIDTNGDDRVTHSEIFEAVARRHPSQAPSKALADVVLMAMDADADRIVSRADAALRESAHHRVAVAHEPDRRDD